MAVWSKVRLSSLAVGLRCDAEYYQPNYLSQAARLAKAHPHIIDTFALVTDGIHASPDEVVSGGVTYLSAKCVKDNTFSLSDGLQISQKQHGTNPRTTLRKNDVLITTVGTIGNAAVVHPELLPANCDRHIGIIRLHPDADIDPYYLATFLNSEYGRFQSFRESTGNVQRNLFIEKIRELKVPRLKCARRVSQQTRAAYKKRRAAELAALKAESLLSNAIGLGGVDLGASGPISYRRRLRDLLAESRFDAEYFSPKYQRVLRILKTQDGRLLNDVASLSERPFGPDVRRKQGTIQYIEIGSLTGDGEAEATRLRTEDAPSRAAWLLHPGDVITSTVRPSRRLSALIREDQAGHVCSSGLVVLTPIEGKGGIDPEVLLTYLRLPVICSILDLYTTASMYPAVPVSRLMRLPVAVPEKRTCRAVVARIREGIALRREANELTEDAKHTIEREITGSSK